MIANWRVLILLICLLGAVLSIGMKVYPYGRYGVEIVYISNDSPAKGILEQGMQITKLNGADIKNYGDWLSKTSNLSGDVTVTANGRQYKFFSNGSLGIDVMDMERTNLDFGLDIKGGTRVVLSPKNVSNKEVIDQIISTLETRANLYGLKEIKFSAVKGEKYYIQIEAAGLGKGVIDELLSTQGNFEAKVEKPVYMDNNSGDFILGKNRYPVSYSNGKVIINSTEIAENETIFLEGIEFQFINKTGEKILFLGTVYTGKDIELVYSDPQRSGVFPRGGVYEFYFVVLVSQDGAQKFADVTTGIKKFFDIRSGEEYLDSKIYLYLDKTLVSDLRIGAALGGQVYTTPQIQGAEVNLDDAVREKLRLQTILRSGALPVGLETLSVDVISPTLGKNFIGSVLVAGLLAGIAVILIIFFRYRSLKVSIPLAFVGFSEIAIILGIAASGDAAIWAGVLVANLAILFFAWTKGQEIEILALIGGLLIPLLGIGFSWTIDLPAIAGIIAAIGTGVDHQIIIADETIVGRKKEEKTIFSTKEKIKAAFFIIFGASATIVAAMVPLMFLGIGLVRGFAITTIIGVLVGVLITRPAYARIIEVFLK